MEPVLTPEEMRAADEATISGGTPGAELMDRAAHAASVVALRMLGGAYGKRVAVICGKGSNGGDGIACARHLAVAGVTCTVFLLASPQGDAALHLDLAGRIAPKGRFRVQDWSRAEFERERPDLVVDAIFGTGFDGEPRGAAAEAIDAIAALDAPVLAIDIASGVSGADGSLPGVAVTADVTVAIQALKVGHVATPGALRAGRCDVADIGIARAEKPKAFLPDPQDVREVLPELELDTHKYRAGVLALIAGSAGMTGAGILSARGALRAGAGLVLLGVPASSASVFEEAVVEAIKVPLPDSEGQLDAKAIDELGERLERAQALAVGPGIGRGPRAVSLVRRALDVQLPMVIDADGLWALGEILREESGVLLTRPPTVLTPHEGEFARLMGTQMRSRVDAVRGAARSLNGVVHLKGARAITAAPDGRVWFNPTGNAGEATGGTGDVLTGVIGSLLAQGVDAADATWAGAFLHGLAADVAAGRVGKRPLVANDVAEALAPARRHVERWVRPTSPLRTVLGPVR